MGQITLGSEEVIKRIKNNIKVNYGDSLDVLRLLELLIERQQKAFVLLLGARTHTDDDVIKCVIDSVANDMCQVKEGLYEVQDLFERFERKSPVMNGYRLSNKPCKYSHAGVMSCEDVMKNLEKFDEDPIGVGRFAYAIGFAPNAKSTGGNCAVNIAKLEDDGVRFIRNGKTRVSISRDEQLHALEILKKAGYFKD